MKRALFVILLLVGAGSALGFWWPFRSSSEIRLSGIVEVQEVRLASKIGGRVAELFVSEGARLSPGMKLLRLDSPELENQKKQLQARAAAAKAEYDRAVAGPRIEENRYAEAAAAAAKARYDRVFAGWRDEEKRWAVSELESANAELKLAQEDFQRIYDLYQSKSSSRAAVDAAIGDRDRARGRAHAAKAKADMYLVGSRPEDIAEAKFEWVKLQEKASELKAGSRVEDVALAEARWREAKAKVEEIEINLREAIVKAPDSYDFKDAVVEIVAVRVGDVVPPNQPVIRVLCEKDLWVKVFVPETELGHVVVGKEVDVTLDSFPGKRFEGRIVQVASVSEFTPRNVQSVDQRRFQVFGVRVRVSHPEGRFHAGMAAEVMLRK